MDDILAGLYMTLIGDAQDLLDPLIAIPTRILRCRYRKSGCATIALQEVNQGKSNVAGQTDVAAMSIGTPACQAIFVIPSTIHIQLHRSKRR